MGYRYDKMIPPKPESMPVLEAYNGAETMWSFPCFYLNTEYPIDWHDYKLHDFLGWPDPRHPGHICQAVPDYGHSFSPASVWKYVDMDKAVKIHLLSEDEAYNATGSVVFDTVDEKGNEIDTEGLSATLTVRPEPEDWIIDITFNPSAPDFAGKPKDYFFNAYVQSDTGVEIFLRGILRLLPGPSSSGL